MRASSFRYLLKQGVRNLWTNRVMAFTSIGVLTTCLLIVGAAYLLTINVNSMVRFIEGQNQMSAFAELDTSPERLVEIADEIAAVENVASGEIVPPEEGLERYIQDTDFAELLEDYTDKIPTTFEISVADIARTAETQEKISAIAGIEQVQASTGMADTLTGLRNIVTTLGSAVILALGIISLVIISNTIRATIFTRRKEINIMKFVGATNAFIRIPFLVEGFMLGLISAGASYLVIWGCYSWLTDLLVQDSTSFLEAMLESIIPFREIAGELALFFGLTGTILGTIGSAVSVRNHVKV